MKWKSLYLSLIAFFFIISICSGQSEKFEIMNQQYGKAMQISRESGIPQDVILIFMVEVGLESPLEANQILSNLKVKFDRESSIRWLNYLLGYRGALFGKDPITIAQMRQKYFGGALLEINPEVGIDSQTSISNGSVNNFKDKASYSKESQIKREQWIDKEELESQNKEHRGLMLETEKFKNDNYASLNSEASSPENSEINPTKNANVEYDNSGRPLSAEIFENTFNYPLSIEIEIENNTNIQEAEALGISLNELFVKSSQFKVSNDYSDVKDIYVYLQLNQFNFEEHIFTSMSEEQRPYYTISVVADLSIVDLLNGNTYAQERMEFTVGKGIILYDTYCQTPQNAVQSAASTFQKKAEKLIRKSFPLEFKVVKDLTNEKGGNGVHLLIAGGSDLGVSTGINFKILEMVRESFNGKAILRKNEVGSGKIVECVDGNFSTLKVTKGKSKVQSRMLRNAELVVVSH